MSRPLPACLLAEVLAALLAATLAAGCATAPGPVARIEAPPARIGVAPAADPRTNELIAYLASVAKAAPLAQKKELAQSAAAYGRAPTAYARLRLGGLYAQPAPGLRDDTRALVLLEPLALSGPAAERPVADLALLLYAQVAERQRLARDDAKKQDDLRERIDAMRSIERTIMDREERQRTR